MTFETLYRRGLLGVADAAPISSFLKSQGWKLGVGRFVAGERLEDALPALHELEKRGLHGILDLLGEFVDTREGVETMTKEILRTLDVLSGEPLDRYMSVKPTQLGLGVGTELALENARRVAKKAREVGANICLDMENYPFVDGTLQVYRTLHGEGFHNLSTVLQSYLYRSLDDLNALLTLDPKPTLRIVKGAYRESDEVAYQDMADVDKTYREMAFAGLDGGAKVNVATHDESIIREVEDYVKAHGLGSERYEFQLLYGVKPALQERLVAAGHRVRIYVPYGEDWYGYFSRRLAERPANLMFVVRGLFG